MLSVWSPANTNSCCLYLGRPCGSDLLGSQPRPSQSVGVCVVNCPSQTQDSSVGPTAWLGTPIPNHTIPYHTIQSGMGFGTPDSKIHCELPCVGCSSPSTQKNNSNQPRGSVPPDGRNHDESPVSAGFGSVGHCQKPSLSEVLAKQPPTNGRSR